MTDGIRTYDLSDVSPLPTLYENDENANDKKETRKIENDKNRKDENRNDENRTNETIIMSNLS